MNNTRSPIEFQVPFTSLEFRFFKVTVYFLALCARCLAMKRSHLGVLVDEVNLFLYRHGDGKCNFCDKNDLGDEFHYIFVCPHLRLFRNRFIDLETRTNFNTLKFKYLFQTKKYYYSEKIM